MSVRTLIAWVRANRWVTLLYLAAIAGHLVVRGVYDPANVDDPWTLSFIHTWLTNGVTDDYVFGNVISNNDGGQSGLEFFGKIQALIYGPALGLLDWNRNAAHVISAMFVAFSMPMWWRIAAHVAPRTNLPALFVACLIVAEPVVTASNEARPDALAFFLVTSSIYATVRAQYVAAGLLSVLAFEVHPMGAISVVYGLAAYFAQINRSLDSKQHLKSLVQLAGGWLIGASVYLLLHQDSIAGVAPLLSESNGGSIGKSLLMYTFDSFAFRHVPEALLFAVALIVFIGSGMWRRERGVTLLLIAAAISLVVFRRGNHHYMLYYTPIALLVGYVVVVHYRKQLPAALLLFALMLSQYGVTAWRNSGFDLDYYVREMRRQVPTGSAPVVAEYNAWFAFYDRTFYGSYKYDQSFYYNRKEFASLGLTEFILVDRLLSEHGPTLGWREKVLPLNISCEPRGFFTLQGRYYGTFHCSQGATP